MDARELVKMVEVLEAVRKDAQLVTVGKNNVRARVDAVKAEYRSKEWENAQIKLARDTETKGMTTRLANMRALADPLIAQEKMWKNRDWVLSILPVSESNGGLFPINRQAESIERSAILNEGQLMNNAQLIQAAEAEMLPGGNLAKVYLYMLVNNNRVGTPGHKKIDTTSLKIPVQDAAIEKLRELKNLVGVAGLDVLEASGKNPHDMVVERLTLAHEMDAIKKENQL